MTIRRRRCAPHARWAAAPTALTDLSVSHPLGAGFRYAVRPLVGLLNGGRNAHSGTAPTGAHGTWPQQLLSWAGMLIHSIVLSLPGFSFISAGWLSFVTTSFMILETHSAHNRPQAGIIMLVAILRGWATVALSHDTSLILPIIERHECSRDFLPVASAMSRSHGSLDQPPGEPWRPDI
jgi:hypothetical protein